MTIPSALVHLCPPSQRLARISLTPHPVPLPQTPLNRPARRTHYRRTPHQTHHHQHHPQLHTGTDTVTGTRAGPALNCNSQILPGTTTLPANKLCPTTYPCATPLTTHKCLSIDIPTPLNCPTAVITHNPTTFGTTTLPAAAIAPVLTVNTT